MLKTYNLKPLKSYSFTGMLMLGLAAGIVTGVPIQDAQAQAAGGGGAGGGGNSGPGNGNMNPDRVLSPQDLAVGIPQCDARRCPQVKQPIAPIVTYEHCGTVQPFYDRYGRLISQSCERRVPFAQ